VSVGAVSDAAGDETEAMLLDSAEGFFKGAHTLVSARKASRDPKGHNPSAWREIAEMGWSGMRLPEALGGVGLPMLPVAALAQRLGQALTLEPFVGCAVMPSAVLRAAADSPVARQLADALCDGSGLVACAWQSRFGELGADATTVTLRDNGKGGLVLSGKRMLVDGASDSWLVPAVDASGPVIVVVRDTDQGVETIRNRMCDGTTTLDLTFESVPVEPKNVLLRGAPASHAMEIALNEGRLVSAAQLAGMAQGAIALAIEHMRTRVQFDRPLAEFQAARHRVVEVHLQVALAQACWRHAAARWTDDSPPGPEIVAAIHAARARSVEAATTAAKSSVQLHGAMGYTQEADIGLFMNAILRASSMLGVASLHRQQFVTRASVEELAR
jgi:alkylation response protein AidB-like acyl-CoA dehydrogenase